MIVKDRNGAELKPGDRVFCPFDNPSILKLITDIHSRTVIDLDNEDLPYDPRDFIKYEKAEPTYSGAEMEKAYRAGEYNISNNKRMEFLDYMDEIKRMKK